MKSDAGVFALAQRSVFTLAPRNSGGFLVLRGGWGRETPFIARIDGMNGFNLRG